MKEPWYLDVWVLMGFFSIVGVLAWVLLPCILGKGKADPETVARIEEEADDGDAEE